MPPALSRRLLTACLLAGVAVAVLPDHARAQETNLRGSVPEDVLATSSPQALATRRLQPAPPPSAPFQPTGDSEALPEISFEPPADPQSVATQPPTPVQTTDPQIDMLRTTAISPDPLDDTNRASRENTRQPTETGRLPAADATPFAPAGIRSGSFILRPSIEQGIRATSNGDNSAGGSSAVLSETTLRLNAQSDWARHQASLDASGSLNKSLSGQSVSEPQLNLQGNLRLDVTDQTKINAGLGYQLRRESASSPNGVVGALKRPIVHSVNGSLGIERDFGLTFGSATARVEHDFYGNAELDSGGTVAQKDRNNTYASITLRSGFQLSPAIRPFVEAEAGKRIYDEQRDNNGYERGGTQFGLRGGVMADMGEKLNGEMSLGYLRANIEDPRLASIDGLSVNAALNWSPKRGTDVRLSASTLVDNGTTAGVSGSMLYLANIDVTHQIRSNLSVNARLDTTIRDNKDGSGTDYTIGTQIGATYWISRFAGINTRLRHEFLKSEVSSREYHANSIYLGLLLQR